jgi:hypothetical protein
MAHIYRTKVTELATALQRSDSRVEATEALRGLVDAIGLTPLASGEELGIELRATWRLCWERPYKRRGRRNPTTSPCKYQMVAGARSQNGVPDVVAA